mmetsp:Transcript_109184/g.308851  ORF Transcript_109184/g.308851 Transcript_109184/m.308851 type:complete len:265 (+) Transcript_109184:1281-2075(+)
MHRTPRPPGSSQAQTGISSGPARGRASAPSWYQVMFIASSRIGALASISGSASAASGVQTNFTVSASVGIREGSCTCKRSSVLPDMGAQLGSTWVGPSRGQRQYQSTVVPILAAWVTRRLTSKSDFRSWRPAWTCFPARLPDVSSLEVLSTSAERAACRSGVHVKPSSMETRSWTAQVLPCSTTDPSGEAATFGVVNSTVSTSTMRPGTTASQSGELDLSLTFTGIMSCTGAAFFGFGRSNGRPVTLACTSVPPCTGARFGDTL